MDRKWASIALGALIAVATGLVAVYGDDGSGRTAVTAVRVDGGTPVPIVRTVNPWQSPTPSPVRRATLTAQAARSTPTVSANPTPAAAPEAESISASARFVVANTDGEGALLRPEPGSSELIRGWDDGTPLVAVGPDRELNGKLWKNVRDPEGHVGWIATDFLAPAR